MAQGKSSGGRSRKRRSASRGRGTSAAEGTAQEPAGDGATAVTTADAKAARRPQARERPRRQKRPDGPLGDTLAFGERPQAPWHPLPLSEILILVGMIAMVIGATRGEAGVLPIAAGVLAVLLGTLDFTWREHMSGYRSHSILLAGIPVAGLHAVLAYGLYLAGAPLIASVIVPVIVDVGVFILLYRRLRARFRVARRARLVAAGL